ncbi:MAG TPA: sigma-70 family RNA polymerase sigma factor [Clostridiales bacterium]|nr:sigma-70 family RNA polymerase sigma factor [Clostridiales bacterium]
MFILLAAQFEDDDRAFMLDLYKNYYNLVRKTIYGITHNMEDIEDLIDDVFVKLIEKITIVRTLDCYKISSYIVYTARSISINYIKHKQVERKYMYFDESIETREDILSYGDQVEKRILRQEEVELLSAAITKFPQAQKDLLYFKYILEMSDKEIAEIFGISPDSVRQYLTRARRNAKKLVGEEIEYVD